MSKNIENERIIKLKNLSEEHLYYEIWMLYEVTFRLAGGIQDTVVRNALIESFVIHAAIILDFLFNKDKIKQDDVIANDFVRDKSVWIEIYTPHIEKLNFIILRRNKEIAHLSYKRLNVSFEEKGWHYIDITREISDLVDLFIDTADKNLLHVKVINLKGVYRNNPIFRSWQSFNNSPMKDIINS